MMTTRLYQLPSRSVDPSTLLLSRSAWYSLYGRKVRPGARFLEKRYWRSYQGSNFVNLYAYDQTVPVKRRKAVAA